MSDLSDYEVKIANEAVEKHRAKGKLAQMEIELNAEYDRLMRGDVFELGNVKRREEIANQLRSIGERK